jgi:hypothetical protein
MLLAVFLGKLRHEMLDQQRQIALAIAQRRQLDGHHKQPVVEVLAEFALLHHLLQIAVGGRDQTHIRLHRLLPAHPLKFTLLEHAQNLHLGGRLDLADFIQEQRAAVRQLKTPAPPLRGPGEGALLVAEQFALQQRGRQGRAMHGHIRPARARAQPMNGVGHQFLAGAALPLHQHRGAGGRHLAHRLVDLVHGGRIRR